MFRKNTHTLHFKKEDIEAIKAIMEMLGIKTKKYYTSNMWGVVDFKANEEKVMEICTKLDKYHIEEAFI